MTVRGVTVPLGFGDVDTITEGTRDNPLRCHDCGAWMIEQVCPTCGRLHGVLELIEGRRMPLPDDLVCPVHGHTLPDPFCSRIVLLPAR